MNERYECSVRNANFTKKVFRLHYKKEHQLQAVKHAAEMYVRHLMYGKGHLEELMHVTVITITVATRKKIHYVQLDPCDILNSKSIFSHE